MKKTLALGLLVVVAVLVFDEYERGRAQVSGGRNAPTDSIPNWQDLAPNATPSGDVAGPADGGEERGAAGVRGAQELGDWRGWAEGGGLVGRIRAVLRRASQSVEYFLLGSSGQPPAGKTPVPPDLTKHFSKVEDATVSIDYGISTIGVPVGGATGFLVTYKGHVYLATNVHVIEAVALREAESTWHDGPRTGPGGERDARFARRHIAFHVFCIPGRRVDPNYLGFMLQTPLPSFKARDGRTLRVGGNMLLSRSRDVVLLPVETDIVPLEFSTEVPGKRENIFIVSNPEAAGAVYLVRGSVKGVGPDRMELRVDGNGLVGGMSGSPVVSAERGKVAGMVSYGRTRAKFDPEKVIKEERGGAWGSSAGSQARDFAYRLDNLDDLAPVTWSRFCWEAGNLYALHERIRNVLHAVNIPVRTVGATSFVPYEIQPDFNSYVATLYSSKVGSLRRLSETSAPESVGSAVDAYRRQLEHALDADVRQLTDLLKRSPITIPYLQRLLGETVERDRQIVLQYLRHKMGQLPSR